MLSSHQKGTSSHYKFISIKLMISNSFYGIDELQIELNTEDDFRAKPVLIIIIPTLK